MPARLQAIVRVAAKHGIDCREPRSGSHYKLVKGSTVFPLSAHNGLKTEIADVYIRKLCEAFGLDVEAFKKDL